MRPRPTGIEFYPLSDFQIQGVVSERRRFQPPLSIDEDPGFFVVMDSTGQALAHIIFEDEPQRQISMKRLSRDEARRRSPRSEV